MSVLFKRHERVCGECGHPFRAARVDATLCSGKCRMRLLRRSGPPLDGRLMAAARDNPAVATIPAPPPSVTDAAVGGSSVTPKPSAEKHPSRKPSPKTAGKKPPKLKPSAVQQLKAARAKGKKVVKISTKPKGRAK